MRVRVKICGVMTPADAVFAADCGADALGLNFYPKSPRFVTDSAADAILRELTPFVAPVGVFVETPVMDTLFCAAKLEWAADRTGKNRETTGKSSSSQRPLSGQDRSLGFGSQLSTKRTFAIRRMHR